MYHHIVLSNSFIVKKNRRALFLRNSINYFLIFLAFSSNVTFGFFRGGASCSGFVSVFSRRFCIISLLVCLFVQLNYFVCDTAKMKPICFRWFFQYAIILCYYTHIDSFLSYQLSKQTASLSMCIALFTFDILITNTFPVLLFSTLFWRALLAGDELLSSFHRHRYDHDTMISIITDA